MKKTKFTEAQIVFTLRQADTGVTVAEVCRKMGLSEATYYNWKKKYGGLGVPELRRHKQLEEENQHLKQLVADLSLDKQMLQDVLKKKYWSPCSVGTRLTTSSTPTASRLAGPAECLAYNAPALLIRHTGGMIRSYASACASWRTCQVRYGSQRLYILLRREGWPDNHKRVHRLYCLEGLNLRSKRPQRNRAAAHRLERLPLGRLHQSWSMDFVADSLFDGRKIRALTIGDKL